MEGIILNLLINNGVSLLVVVLLLILWWSWKKDLLALKELTDARDSILGTEKIKGFGELLEERAKQIMSIKESLVYIAERKIDSEEAYKNFTKYEHLEAIGGKLELTLESIRNEMIGMRKENIENRKDVRLIIERLLVKSER